jgi:acetyltransferase
LEEVVSLGDGAIFLLRPIRPEDEPQLQATFRKLSPENIRLRLFIPLRTLSHDLAARLTQIDYDREMALIVTEPGPAGTGVVRIASDPDKERAEFAIVVRDDTTRRGLGTLLMSRITAYATSSGIQEIFGNVLPENESMLSICRRLGFTLRHDIDAPKMIRLANSPT